MDAIFDHQTMILATDLRDTIKRDTALYYGKLRCLPFEKGYGYTLKWGADTIADSTPVRVYGQPDQLGRVQSWGSRGFAFSREVVEDIISRIHAGEVPDTFECFVNGSSDGVYPTADTARAHALTYPADFEWTIFKNGHLLEKGVTA